jgi:hypothetical protein
VTPSYPGRGIFAALRLMAVSIGDIHDVPAAVTISLPARTLVLSAADVERLYDELWRVATCGRRGAVTAAAWLRNRSQFQPDRTISFEGDEADAVGHALNRLAIADAVAQV